MASRILRSQSEVDDALQDAFVRVWQAADESSTVRNSRGMLTTILKNVCIDRLRRRQNLPYEELNADGSAGGIGRSGTDVVEDRDMIDNVARLASKHLTGLTRRAFELYVFHELDYQEVASELGITAEVARTYVSRARKTIRQFIKNGAL